ncbi:hydrogenase maturation nickel metallochaperone HypA [Paludisphaera borealis]|uniref:Hydrogenase maturation factor HypA n=1 Tax=Paludisphaera borealis TaxID=1387353 RepID=A0A1U7CVK8_9BACT|nr:hydrogenase maturation nickel metallochaperone HypA [Paludisphaera borealis]APW62965.1 hydrogenase nickel incorporation protein HypA [Paludisphaera borealis]
MHELSIALSILDMAEEEAERRGGRIVAVHLKLGPLSGVVARALASAYEMAREGTPLDQAELVIEEVPIVAYCATCDVEHLPDAFDLRCPGCGAPTPTIRGGRELEIVALEIVS